MPARKEEWGHNFVSEDRKPLRETDPDALWIEALSKERKGAELTLRKLFAQDEAAFRKIRELQSEWELKLALLNGQNQNLAKGGYPVLGEERRQTRRQIVLSEGRLDWIRETHELREKIWDEKYRRWGDYGDPRDWESLVDARSLADKTQRFLHVAQKKNPDGVIPYEKEIREMLKDLERRSPGIIEGAIAQFENYNKNLEQNNRTVTEVNEEEMTNEQRTRWIRYQQHRAAYTASVKLLSSAL